MGIEFSTYELFPSSSYTGYPEVNPAYGYKIQHLKTIEMRGSIENGFRTKKEWNEYFRLNESRIINEYKERANIRLKIND